MEFRRRQPCAEASLIEADSGRHEFDRLALKAADQKACWNFRFGADSGPSRGKSCSRQSARSGSSDAAGNPPPTTQCGSSRYASLVPALFGLTALAQHCFLESVGRQPRRRDCQSDVSPNCGVHYHEFAMSASRRLRSYRTEGFLDLVRSNPTPTSFRPLQEPCTHCHDRCSAPSRCRSLSVREKEFWEANSRVKERNRRPRAYLARGVENAKHRAYWTNVGRALPNRFGQPPLGLWHIR